MIELTELEQKALKELQKSSAGNGHDFGCVEDVKWDGTRQQLGGVITSLQGKGVLTMYEPHRTDWGMVTQFILNEEFQGE